MDCFARPNKAKKLTDTQKGRIISLRKDGHHKLADIVQSTLLSKPFINGFKSMNKTGTLKENWFQEDRK